MSLERRRVRGAAWLLAGGLSLSFALVAGLYSLSVPSWEAPDEPAHYAYAAALLDTGALPKMTTGHGPTEAHQPPLYYMLTAALMAPIDRGDR